MEQCTCDASHYETSHVFMLSFFSVSLSLAHLVKHNLHRKLLKSNRHTVVNLMTPILCSCELVGFILGIIQEEKD